MHKSQVANQRTTLINSAIASLSISELITLVGINLLLFQVAIQPVLPTASYLDEMACVALAASAFFRKQVPLSRQLRWSFGFLLLFFLTTVVSSLLSDVPVKMAAVYTDAFTCAKFAITLWASYRCFTSHGRFLVILQAEARLLLPALMIMAVINLFTDIGMGSPGDFGIPRAFRFVYYHPSAVVWLVVALVSTLLFDIKRNSNFIIFGLVVACSTLTTKGIGWAVAMSVIMVLMNRQGRISVLSICVSLAALVSSAWGSIILYYSNSTMTTARSVLLSTSIEIAEMFFPLGSGFATYGSAVTADPNVYSSLYYQYGLNTVYGLSPTNTSYLSDSFWPIVLAQSGIIGSICFIGFLLCLIWAVFRFEDRPVIAWFPTLCVIGYLILGSAAESAFFNPSSVYLAILLGVYMGRNSIECKET